MTEKELLASPFCVLAIDPGLSGAVCRLGNGRFDLRRDFKKKEEIALAIRDLSFGITHAVIELVHAMPGQGVCSMFSFGRSSGVADGALALCFAGAVEEVSPQKWQNWFRTRLGIPKEVGFDSRQLATKIFPSHGPYFSRKKDHNSADAALLAVWRLSNPV